MFCYFNPATSSPKDVTYFSTAQTIYLTTDIALLHQIIDMVAQHCDGKVRVSLHVLCILLVPVQLVSVVV